MTIEKREAVETGGLSAVLEPQLLRREWLQDFQPNVEALVWEGSEEPPIQFYVFWFWIRAILVQDKKKKIATVQAVQNVYRAEKKVLQVAVQY